jgi:hypothetical protein
MRRRPPHGRAVGGGPLLDAARPRAPLSHPHPPVSRPPPRAPRPPQDAYGGIDLSDNDLTRLDGFPVLRRLRTLLVSNNRIAAIGGGPGGAPLSSALPNLEALVAAHNRLGTLADLAPLTGLTRLTLLSLVGNPVTRAGHYRAFLIASLPALALLDFTRVTRKERADAARFFASKKGKAVLADIKGAAGRAAAAAATAAAAAAAAPAAAGAGAAGAGASVGGPPRAGGSAALTPEESARLVAMLDAAKTQEELEPIERALKEGRIAEYLRGPAGGGLG